MLITSRRIIRYKENTDIVKWKPVHRIVLDGDEREEEKERRREWSYLSIYCQIGCLTLAAYLDACGTQQFLGSDKEKWNEINML
jgi:hypothetical protein